MSNDKVKPITLSISSALHKKAKLFVLENDLNSLSALVSELLTNHINENLNKVDVSDE